MWRELRPGRRLLKPQPGSMHRRVPSASLMTACHTLASVVIVSEPLYDGAHGDPTRPRRAQPNSGTAEAHDDPSREPEFVQVGFLDSDVAIVRLQANADAAGKREVQPASGLQRESVP